MIKNKGYTLVEVLTAMVIFSLVISIAVSSYRYFFSATGKTSKNKDDLALLTKRKIINQSIKAMQAYYYRNFEGTNKLFFYGDQNVVSFVSDHPSLLEEPLVVANLYVTNSGKDLMYCEQGLGTVNLDNYKFRESQCEHKLVYLTNEQIKMSFFAWENHLELDDFYSEFTTQVVEPKPKWRLQYDAKTTLSLPLFIKVSLTGKNKMLPNEFMFKIQEELPYTKRRKNAFAG